MSFRSPFDFIPSHSHVARAAHTTNRSGYYFENTNKKLIIIVSENKNTRMHWETNRRLRFWTNPKICRNHIRSYDRANFSFNRPFLRKPRVESPHKNYTSQLIHERGKVHLFQEFFVDPFDLTTNSTTISTTFGSQPYKN